MKSLRNILVIMIMLGLLAPGFFALPVEAALPQSKHSLIVKYKGETSPREIAIPKNQSLESALRQYENNKNIEYAEPNYIYTASITPSDLHYNEQWYLRRVQAPEAWNRNATSPTITIAIIDSGVQISHPDLAPNIWKNPSEKIGNNKDDDGNGLIDDINGWDFVNNVADPSPKFKPGFTEGGVIHGTVIAGIAAAAGNNNEGIAGLTWQTKLMALKALDDQGNGDTGAVIKAIDYAVAKGANIINLSFVGFGYSRALEDAVRRAYHAGVIVVAAAGNEQTAGHGVNLNTRPVYPACFRDTDGKKLVVGVAATDPLDQKAEFSGYGNTCIDIAAPGVSFYTTTVYAPEKSVNGEFFDKRYDGYWSGTSMAVPVISGIISLIQATNPTLSAAQVLSTLYLNADNIDQLNPEYAGHLGNGRVNAYRSISDAQDTLFRKTGHFAFASVAAQSPIVTLTDSFGHKENEFLAYKESFIGGVNIVTADMDNDGQEEIITSPVHGLEADVRIFNSAGKMLSHFLAYPYAFKGGVNVAAADIDLDGRLEIITAPASGFEPLVKIFTPQGKLIRSFLAYPSTFKNGLTLAVGDVRSEAGMEIITAPNKGGVPQVKVFSPAGKFLNSFIVGKKTETVGLRIAVGDLDGNPRRRQPEIIISRQSGAPLVSTYDFRGNLRGQWLAYSAGFTGDVRVLTGDLNRDGFTDIITVPGPSGAPHVRIFKHTGEIRTSFYALNQSNVGGISAGVFLINN